jgi:hypothetical protein
LPFNLLLGIPHPKKCKFQAPKSKSQENNNRANSKPINFKATVQEVCPMVEYL